MKPNALAPGPRAWLVLFLVASSAAIGWIGWQRQHRPALGGDVARTAAELVRRDGLLWDPILSRPYSGWLIERFPTKALRSRSAVVDGKLQGLSEGWHPNGQLQIREEFVAGQSDGLVTRWNEDGTKLSEGIARHGKLTGIFRRWHPNGQLAEELSLQAGQPEGTCRSWYADGRLKAEARLQNGRVLSQRFW
ncbi:MAG: hypothetical protein U1G07_12945 [Verrucomicrobiota bacterium]